MSPARTETRAVTTVVVLVCLAAVGCGTGSAEGHDAGTGSAGGATPGGSGASVGAAGTAGAAGGGPGTAGSSPAEIGGSSGSASDAGVRGLTFTLGPNLITNGDFSDGSTGWLLTTTGAGSVPSSVSGGQFCASLAAGVPSMTIGWPVSPIQPVDLPRGVIYQFSFHVSSTAPIPSTSFSDKVGGSLTYNADFQSKDDALMIDTETFTHTFSLPAEDSSAGIAITLDGVTIDVTVCLSDVKLQQVFVSDGGTP